MLFIAAKYKELILEIHEIQVIFSGLSLEGSDFECGLGITEGRKFPLYVGKICQPWVEKQRYEIRKEMFQYYKCIQNAMDNSGLELCANVINRKHSGN